MGISAVPFDPELGGDLIGGPKADTADVVHETVRILAHELDSVGAVGPEGSDGSRSPHAMHVEKELFASRGKPRAGSWGVRAGSRGFVRAVAGERGLAARARRSARRSRSTPPALYNLVGGFATVHEAAVDVDSEGWPLVAR